MAPVDDRDAAADAVARRKLRVTWTAPDLDGAPDRAALLAGIWAALRRQRAAPGISQDEAVEVRAITPAADGLRVSLGYVFDHDFASQYDRCDGFDVELVLDGAGALIAIAAWTPAATD